MKQSYPYFLCVVKQLPPMREQRLQQRLTTGCFKLFRLILRYFFTKERKKTNWVLRQAFVVAMVAMIEVETAVAVVIRLHKFIRLAKTCFI